MSRISQNVYWETTHQKMAISDRLILRAYSRFVEKLNDSFERLSKKCQEIREGHVPLSLKSQKSAGINHLPLETKAKISFSETISNPVPIGHRMKLQPAEMISPTESSVDSIDLSQDTSYFTERPNCFRNLDKEYHIEDSPENETQLDFSLWEDDENSVGSNMTTKQFKSPKFLGARSYSTQVPTKHHWATQRSQSMYAPK